MQREVFDLVAIAYCDIQSMFALRRVSKAIRASVSADAVAAGVPFRLWALRRRIGPLDYREVVLLGQSLDHDLLTFRAERVNAAFIRERTVGYILTPSLVWKGRVDTLQMLLENDNIPSMGEVLTTAIIARRPDVLRWVRSVAPPRTWPGDLCLRATWYNDPTTVSDLASRGFRHDWEEIAVSAAGLGHAGVLLLASVRMRKDGFPPQFREVTSVCAEAVSRMNLEGLRCAAGLGFELDRELCLKIYRKDTYQPKEPVLRWLLERP